MGNIGREQARFDVLPEPEFAVTPDGELYEWSPTAPVGRTAPPVRRETSEPVTPERVDH